LSDAYEIKHIIGQGGFASVYLARDSIFFCLKIPIGISKKLRAIKITKINKKLSNSNFGDFIKNEVNVLRILKSKHICRFIEVFEDTTQVAIVLDYIKGENLYDVLKKGKKLSTEEVFYIIHILLQVLEEMNFKGFAHRDVKPSNIIIKRLEGLEDGDQL
jgi:serine/threonine protein kinase